jgi:hypothetical protein
MKLTKIKRIAVKKLPAPIRTIINIRVRRWFDKYYGNSYHSMRIIVNNDYTNELVIPMCYGSYDSSGTRELIQKNFAIKCRKYKLYDGTMVAGNILNDDSILVVESFMDVTKRECKAFGTKN